MFSEEFSWYVGGMEREKAEQFLIEVSIIKIQCTCSFTNDLYYRMVNKENSWLEKESIRKDIMLYQ